uniref:ARAD1C10274p n=1 Tax=Blastobotrys adeninivorans TaxID=409370 RepID=A0A060T596_BLAAD
MSDSGTVNDILAKLEIENKIKEGAENLLQVFDTRKLKDGKEVYKQQVESQLDAANAKIQLLQLQLQEHGFTRSSLNLGNTPHSISPDLSEPDPGQESPTWSLGDILQSFEPAKQDAEFLVARANDLVSLLQRHPLLKYDLAMAQVGDKIRILLLHRQSEVIAAGYRVARYTITDLESLKNIRKLHTDFLLIRTLCQDGTAHVERLQAIKFIRAYLDLPGGVDEVTVGVVRALVAVAEHGEDKLRTIATESLAEIFIQNPEIIFRGGGIRVLMQAVVEGPYELSVPIAMALAFAMEWPKSRQLLRGGRDLDYLLSAITDFQVRGHVHSEKLINSAQVISNLLRSWAGLLAFSADNFNAIRVLVNSLAVATPALRDILLDLFFSVLCIRPLSWSSSFLAGRRLTTFGRVSDLKEMIASAADKEASEKTHCRFVDHFTALLVQILIECGLIDTLVHILESSEEASNKRKTTLLLSEILSMMGNLLPSRLVEKLSALPKLFNTAMESYQTQENALASGAIFQIDKISRNIQKTRQLSNEDGLDNMSTNNNSSSKITSYDDRSSRVRVKMGVQIDDASFKQLLLDTQVLNTKTYSKWNWDALSELIHGPLLNPKRLEEAIKTTKFMKRLMSFYRPFKYRFSSIKRTKPNQKYIDVGKDLLVTLLSSQEGVKYLTENKLLRQIAECLAQLDPMSGITSPEPLFSSQRLQNTLSFGYFTLLGTLSGDTNGMQMMERWRMFNMFYHISELNTREDLIRSFVVSMDYKLHGHTRIILSKTLTTGSKDVRLFATSHLRTLLNSDPDTQKWAVELLVTQLYDTEVEICKLAIDVIEEFCGIPENLEHFIGLQPSLDHLGDVATPLLLRFLSSSVGFRYLKELDYVYTEMDNWFHGQNENYVVQIEEYLESANMSWSPSSTKWGVGANVDKENDPPASAPRHFYGELTLTDEGCQLLKSRGHFGMFVQFLHDHKNECEDPEIILKLKGCLWAIGNVGRNPKGAPFLEDCEVIRDIVDITQQSEIFSLKGTAFFALGLISSTEEGMEILDEYQWDSVYKMMLQPKGICLPRDLSSLFGTNIDPPKHNVANGKIDGKANSKTDADANANGTTNSTKGTPDSTVVNDSNGSGPEADGSGGKLRSKSVAEDNADEEIDFPSMPVDPVRRKILDALRDLSNQILANEASRQLVKFESKYGDRFQSVDLFLETMGLLEKYRYKLPVRRFIFELFNTSTLIERLIRRQKEYRRWARLSQDSKGQVPAIAPSPQMNQSPRSRAPSQAHD